MSGHPPTTEAVKGEIARELVKVQESSYGESACNVEVAIHDTFVAVIMDLELSRAEKTLIESGNGASVKTSREAFQVAVGDTFTAVVERATGRRVKSFAGRAMVEESPPWAMEVFRLDQARPAA